MEKKSFANRIILYLLFSIMVIILFTTCKKDKLFDKNDKTTSCPDPVANFTYNIDSIVAGGYQGYIATVYVSLQSVNDPDVKYHWSFGDNDTSVIPVITHIYNIGQAIDMADGKHWVFQGDTVQTFNITLGAINCDNDTVLQTNALTITVKPSELYSTATKYFWSLE